MDKYVNKMRVRSVDALRGFDMLMIIFADRFFFALHEGADSNITSLLAKQFQHPDWFGFGFYDIIMPLFLFIVGIVIPVSLTRKKEQNASKASIHISLFRRFIILFILGWIVQGNLLDLNPDRFQIMSNTLQAIAVGYFFSSLFYLYFPQKWIYGIFALCLLIYTVLLTVPSIPEVGRSELLPDKNFAVYVENLIFGKYADSSGGHYTWLLSSFGFTATVLSGVFAGELICSNNTRKKIAIYLTVIGVAGIILGFILGIWHPIVKKIWTSSFVLFTSGICFLLLALFYWIIDVKGYYKWTFPLTVIGMNAIVAYVASHVLNFPEIAHSLLFGLEKFTGLYYDMTLTLGGFGILYFILWYMYQNKTFVKI